jgi:amidophosphoribosyltransferase
MLRSAGAREIHVRISCPPTAHPCFFGIDFPTTEELIAGQKTVEEIREYVHADSLGYLSVDGLLSPFKNKGDFCRACFTGEYPVNVTGFRGKKMLEKNSQNLQLDL